MTRRNVRVFSRTGEAIMIAVPALAVLAGLVELLFLKTAALPDKTWMTYWAKILFFEAAHTSFTFALMWCSPPVRAYLRERGRRTRFKDRFVFLLLLAVSAGMAGLMWSAPAPGSWGLTAFAAGLILFDMATRHHAIRQHLGVSLMYNQELRRSAALTPAELAAVARSETWERRLNKFLVFTQVSRGLLIAPAVGLLSGSVLDPVFFAKAATAIFAVHALLCLPVLAFIATDHFVRRMPAKKALFHLRLLLYPLGPFSILADLVPRGAHSIEYALVYDKMRRHPAHAGPSVRGPMLLVTAALFLYLTLETSFLRNLVLGGGRWTFVDAAIYSIMFFHSVAHYYADRVIFRMRDPLARAHVGPLLLTPAAEAGTDRPAVPARAV